MAEEVSGPKETLGLGELINCDARAKVHNFPGFVYADSSMIKPSAATAKESKFTNTGKSTWIVPITAKYAGDKVTKTIICSNVILDTASMPPKGDFFSVGLPAALVNHLASDRGHNFNVKAKVCPNDEGGHVWTTSQMAKLEEFTFTDAEIAKEQFLSAMLSLRKKGMSAIGIAAFAVRFKSTVPTGSSLEDADKAGYEVGITLTSFVVLDVTDIKNPNAIEKSTVGLIDIADKELSGMGRTYKEIMEGVTKMKV